MSVFLKKIWLVRFDWKKMQVQIYATFTTSQKFFVAALLRGFNHHFFSSWCFTKSITKCIG
jgi:hypothetical protein